MIDKQQEILQKYKITIHSYENNSIGDIPSFLKKINKITKTNEDSIIQLLFTDNICGMSCLKQAITQAFKSFDENENFAKDKGLEICVRLSAQRQITEALKILGIKDNSNITVVYIDTNDNQISEVEKLLSNRNDDLIEEYDLDNIVKVYGLDSNENIVQRLNEKIALLSLKN